MPSQVPPSAVNLRQLAVATHEGFSAHGLVRVSDGLRREGGREEGGRDGGRMSGSTEYNQQKNSTSLEEIRRNCRKLNRR